MGELKKMKDAFDLKKKVTNSTLSRQYLNTKGRKKIKNSYNKMSDHVQSCCTIVLFVSIKTDVPVILKSRSQ